MVKITTDNLILNGKVLADGVYGNSGSGGGSGGAILIQTSSFEGNGSISANGGAGHRLVSRTNFGTNTFLGGAGSGGRIAVYFTNNTFNGSITSQGGVANEAYSGGPGTVFMKDAVSGFSKLIVDNGGLAIYIQEISSMDATRGTIAWLTEENVVSFEFDEVIISGNAGLAIEPTGSVATSNAINISFILQLSFKSNLT